VFAEIRAENGAFTLARQADSSQFTVGHGRRRHRHDCDGRGPAGVRVRGATGEEGRLPSVDVIADGHPSTAVRVNISPGQTESVDFAFTAPEAGVPVLVHTPMLDDVETSVPDSARPCA